MYLVIDVETTGRNKGEDAVGDFVASPFYVQNQIVCEAYKYEDEQTIHFDNGVFDDDDIVPWGILSSGIVDLVIGHNISFDLHYLRKTFPEWAKFIESNKIRIWDTQKVEYLLSGQTTIMPDLDTCAVKYGGTLKDDRIKKFFEQGGCASELPMEILRPYNETDVFNSEIIYQAQVVEAEKRGLLTLIQEIEMPSLLSTNEMEWNGMVLEAKKLSYQASEVERERDELANQITDVFRNYLVGLSNININSSHLLSAVVFGGSYVVEDKECIGEFKSGKQKGQPKYKKIKVEKFTNGFGIIPDPKWKSSKKGVYLTNEEILTSIASKCDFVKSYLKLRALNKDYVTYYLGLTKLMWPQDKTVRPNINASVTATGRLSESAPNLQNTPRGDKSSIKDCFVSRYGDDGYIVEGDYSQLEVLVQAILSNDEVMKEDIRNGTDFHALRLSYQLGVPYKEVIEGLARGDGLLKQGRTEIKTGFSFPRAYGAGAKSISANTGIDLKVVQGIIDSEERRYFSVAKWSADNLEEVKQSRFLSGLVTKNGYPRGIGKLKSVTGKEYTFYEYDTPDFLHKVGKYTSFKPTEIKNYPVQGFAYEIIAAALALLRPQVVGIEGIKLINSVHDSILLDCRKNLLDFCCQILYNSMYRARYVLEKLFSLDFGLDLGVDIKYGESWYKTKSYQGRLDLPSEIPY